MHKKTPQIYKSLLNSLGRDKVIKIKKIDKSEHDAIFLGDNHYITKDGEITKNFSKKFKHE